MNDEVRKYLAEKYGLNQPEQQAEQPSIDPQYLETDDEANARMQAGMQQAADRSSSDMEMDRLLSAKEQDLIKPEMPPQPELPQEPQMQFPEARPASQIMSEGISPAMHPSQLAAGEQAGIPDVQPSIDVPHAQAQAELNEPPIDMPKEGHVNTDLKADDARIKDQSIADEKLKETDPRQYIMRKYGIGPELGEEKLKELQDKANSQRFWTNQAENMLDIGYKFKNMEMSPSDLAMFERQRKEADMPVEQFQARRKLAGENVDLTKKMIENVTSDLDADQKSRMAQPGSPISESIKKMIAKFNPELAQTPGWDKMSGNDAMELMKPTEAFERLETMKATKENALASKNEAASRKDVEKGFKDLDAVTNPFKARAGLLAEAQKNRQNIERLQGLVERDENGHFSLTKPESEEFSIGLARALAGGTQTSRAQVEAIVPHTGKGLVQDVKSWLINKPEGREQQEFIKNMYKTILTEKSVAEQQVKRAQLEAFMSSDDLREKDEDKFERKLNARGLTMDEYNQFVQARKEGKGTDLDFAKARQEVAGNKLLNPEPKIPTVTIRRKADGMKKTLPADKAQKYLQDPGFEKVQ